MLKPERLPPKTCLLHKGDGREASQQLEEIRRLFNTLLDLARKEVGCELDVNAKTLFRELRVYLDKVEKNLPSKEALRRRLKARERKQRWRKRHGIDGAE